MALCGAYFEDTLSMKKKIWMNSDRRRLMIPTKTEEEIVEE